MPGRTCTLAASFTGGPSGQDTDPSNLGGFNLRASAGTLSPVDETTTQTYQETGDLTHSFTGNDQTAREANRTAPTETDLTADIRTFTNSVNGGGELGRRSQGSSPMTVSEPDAGDPTGEPEPCIVSDTPGFGVGLVALSLLGAVLVLAVRRD